jgi:hypothetical protein
VNRCGRSPAGYIVCEQLPKRLARRHRDNKMIETREIRKAPRCMPLSCALQTSGHSGSDSSILAAQPGRVDYSSTDAVRLWTHLTRQHTTGQTSPLHQLRLPTARARRASPIWPGTTACTTHLMQPLALTPYPCLAKPAPALVSPVQSAPDTCLSTGHCLNSRV